ncbi:YTH domain-containing protein [Ranunculus cassubicifolius]
MATATAKTKSDKPIEELMKNLKVDQATKPGESNPVPPKGRSPSEATSCISSSDLTGSVKSNDTDQEYLVTDQGLYYPPSSYYGYYYPGYDGSVGELDNQGYYLGSDGLEIQYPTMQGDNGLVYYMPGYQSGYVPYNPYIPNATIGVDGQYLSPQSYMLSPVSSPQPIAASGYYANPLSYGSDVMQSYIWDPTFQAGDLTQANGYNVIPTVPVSNHTITSSKSTPPTKSINTDTRPSLPPLDVSSGPGIFNDLKPVNKAAAALAKSYYPLTKYPYTNQAKPGLFYPNTSIKANSRGWGGTEKLKPRGKPNGFGDFDLLNEQNRGPRTLGPKTSVASETDAAEGGNDDTTNNSATVISRDEYNLPDFPTKYDQGLFFVIKSYSEDDIHKSIKYNVWASTPNGNKRLDSAYQEAQEKVNQKGSKCPIFLFFSVNASGQFCGVAEMIGRVDFDKSMDFWQQDKWNGFFPVKWHIIKDVPNPHFRHIILENNDNKPVTNSRDTQEIRYPQGLEMLNVFKNYLSKTSILDDFSFYESRQKVMQDKRIRSPVMHRFTHPQKLDEVTQVVKQPVDTVVSQAVAPVEKEQTPPSEETKTSEEPAVEVVEDDKAKE